MKRFSFALATAVLCTVSFALSACSSGVGNPGTGGGSSSASGVLSVPSATCGSSACMNSTSSLASSSALNSATTIASYGANLYSYFNSTTIPQMNVYMGQIEAAFASNNITTCAQAAATSLANNVDIGGFLVDISAGDTLVPAGFTGGNATTQRKYVVKTAAGSAFAILQIHCSGSYRTMYARVRNSGTTMETWTQTDGTTKIIYGAYDDATTKRTLYFKSGSTTAFEMYAIANGITYNGATVSVGLAGNVNLAPGLGNLAFASGAATNATALSYSPVDTNWLGGDLRHCYTNLLASTVEAAGSSCSGLGFSSLGTVLRNGAAWTVNGMNTPISSTY